MLNKDDVVGMLKNYLLPGAYPVAKADIETTIDFIESQTQEAELGRAAVEALKKLDCGEEDSQPCDSIFKRFGNDDIWCENRTNCRRTPAADIPGGLDTGA